MEITILIDNHKNELAYRSEHGLSMLIELGDVKVLFDTGRSDAFIQNAKVLGKDLKLVDFVVLSHAHYDHTGGLEAFLALNKKAKIVIKREAVEEQKLSKSAGVERDISFPMKEKLQAFEQRVIWANKNFELVPSLHVFANINRPLGQPFTDSFLYTKYDGEFVPDLFKDELFMAVVNGHKLIIFTGCAHNGVENMIQTAIDFTGIKEIEFITGGTHLNRATERQVDETIKALKLYNIKRAAFNHCSGSNNIKKMNEELKADVEYAYAGCSYII